MEPLYKLNALSELKTSQILGEVFYILIGVIFILVGLKSLQDKGLKEAKTTALFWFVLAFTFICGPYLPALVTGICVILLAVLTALKKVKPSASDVPSAQNTRANADKIGYKVFIPPVILATLSVIIAINFKSLGAANALCISAVISIIVTLLITKSSPSNVIKDGTRLMDNVGTTGILPQVLAALGALFTKAGVGEVISGGVSSIVPEGNLLIGIIVYCIAMALFTAIMGNGFAAFSVITVGIAIPFLINHGANPVVIGALGLTAGYCGTLMTPMAANFNIMPAALLETKDKYGIIKAQLPVAIIMLVIHMILMYVFAIPH